LEILKLPQTINNLFSQENPNFSSQLLSQYFYLWEGVERTFTRWWVHQIVDIVDCTTAMQPTTLAKTKKINTGDFSGAASGGHFDA
jgi:hypothetical protein